MRRLLLPLVGIVLVLTTAACLPSPGTPPTFPDGPGNDGSAANATPQGFGFFVGDGVIEHQNDEDWYSFTTGNNVPTTAICYQNDGLGFEVQRPAGTVIASGDCLTPGNVADFSPDPGATTYVRIFSLGTGSGSYQLSVNDT